MSHHATSPDNGTPEAEFAHVLFLDLVGYSLVPTEEQARRVTALREAVRAAATYKRAIATSDTLVTVSSGDGIALAFLRNPLAPVLCAREIAEALAHLPEPLLIRMGVHSGPVSRLADISGNVTMIGAGINLAARVMVCAAPGEILLSAASATAVREFSGWAERLTDLGDVEVKHGVLMHLFRLELSEGQAPLHPLAGTRPNNGDAGKTGEVETGQGTYVSPSPTGEAGIIGRGGRGVKAVPSGTPIIGPGTRERVEGGQTGGLFQSLPEPAGGAVPLDSSFYVVRPTDTELERALLRRDSGVLIKGARQVGKTSLLARGLRTARASGARVALTDFQALAAEHLASTDALYRALADLLADQLDIEEAAWDSARGASTNLERYLRREVLAGSTPLVWAMDEADRLFTVPFGSEVFGLLRSWHNRRALDPDGPWGRLTLAITYATEAHLFISDLNQSPFNVGTRLSLDDFTVEQTADLNTRYGAPLAPNEVGQLHALVGGQPYLTRCALDVLAGPRPRLTLAAFTAQAPTDEGPFGDHLRRLQLSLAQDTTLAQAARAILEGRPCPGAAAFYRLRAAGVVRGSGPENAALRCPVYAEYLSSRLPAIP